MLDSAKSGLKKLIPYDLLKLQRDRKALKLWESQGRPAPPPHIIKENVIRDYAKKFKTRILIETGTYRGDMVYALKKCFDKVISFELDSQLQKAASERFATHKDIQIVLGDSGQILGEHLGKIHEPCLFWLDGHYSGGVTAKASLVTPIKNEVEHIFAHPVSGHVILVDDARCFDGTNDYPTLDELRTLIHSHKPGWHVSVSDDIIRIHENR